MEYSVRASSDYHSPYGFRLQPTRNSSKGSVASYKQRIDSMFDDTQSVATETGNYRDTHQSPSALDNEDISKMIENDNKMLVKNMVQARIEKMFAEVEGDGEARPLNSKVDSSTFYVDYLGSIPLTKKVSSLEGLQGPLKDLYLNHKQMGNVEPVFQDILEISNCGLRVKYVDEDQDELVEHLNPFPTIAVWAAVKLVVRPRGLGHGKEFGLDYAFMPLISDPESTDKITLFTKLTPNEASYFTGDYYSDHSPLFVAVMRKLGVSRQLECHGFICISNESAIVIAANLYKALVITMAKNQPSQDNAKKKNLKHRNGVNTVCSVGGSSVAGDLENSNVSNNCDPPKLPPPNFKKELESSSNSKHVQPNGLNKLPPPRPPRKGKRTPVKNTNDMVVVHVKHPDPDEILQLPSPLLQSSHLLKSNSFNFSSANSNGNISESCKQFHYKNDIGHKAEELQRSSNRCCKKPEGKSNSFSIKEYSERGDILTKVAIPRSHSFLNANGPLSSRYNRHASAGPLGGNEIQRKHSIGSPLGLNELFTEFRLQEGLNNMEDILNAIINYDGMSFNDLKPIYKEFLLKLAVTLTKDELYQRSKSIMQRQKNRKRKIKRKNSCKLKNTLTVGGGLRKVVRRSLIKLKLKKSSKPNSFQFSSLLFPSSNRFRSKTPVHRTPSYLKSYGFPYSSSSNESSLLTHTRTKSSQILHLSNFEQSNLISHGSEERLLSHSPFKSSPKSKKANPVGNNISEDSDFFSLKVCDKNRKSRSPVKTRMHGTDNCLNHASSGYFSCSDCSYDSESCTCTSADKCYCSMGNHRHKEQNQGKHMSLTSCECDTDSCFESEKCYCNQRRKPSVFEQLKQQGFVASESSLSRANSPNTAWQKNEEAMSKSKGKFFKRNKEELQSSKSLQFLKVRPRHNSMSQLNLESKYKPDNIYQTPVEAFEGRYSRRIHDKSSISSSPVTSSSESKSIKSLSSQRRSFSSDNLALDYNMFSTPSKTEAETEERDAENQEPQQQKVLVVSTRDPKGRIVYVSATQRPNSSIRTSDAKRDNNDAISVKKTAEIAALFSNVKFNNRTVNSAKEEVIYNTLEPPDSFFCRSGSGYKRPSLESSLGYFP